MRPNVRFVLLSGLCLFAVSELSVTSAQDTEGVSSPSSAALSAEYLAAIDLGFNEFAAGNYPEARARFLEAEAIMPNARLSRALGMVEYELRNYPKTVEHLESALESNVRPLDDPERHEASELLEQARDYVARYTIRAKPSTVRLYLDNGELQLAADQSVLLSVGDHVLEAQAQGHRPLQRKLHVEKRTDAVIDLALEPLAPLDALPPVSTAPRIPFEPRSTVADDTSLLASPWLWVCVGTVVAGAGVALALALQPNSRVEVGEPISTGRTPPGASISLLRGL